MKYLVLCLLAAIVLAAQHRQKTASKAATVVDSVNTPPRMDGNTGQYDTVRKLRKKADRKKAGQGPVYDYHIDTDTITIKPAAPEQ